MGYRAVELRDGWRLIFLGGYHRDFDTAANRAAERSAKRPGHYLVLFVTVDKHARDMTHEDLEAPL